MPGGIDTAGAGADASGRAIIIQPNDKSLSVAQAIYHHITAKTERIFESFQDSYEIGDQEIAQIYHKIKQVAQRHHEEEWSCTVDHALFKKERTVHSSFEKFLSSDRSQSCPTSDIAIEYDFLSRNPLININEEIKPERYKISVRINREAQLKSDDDNEADRRIYSRYYNYASIYVRIEYVDYTIARSLLAAVREWVEGLEKIEKPVLVSFLLKREYELFYLIPVTFSATWLLGYGISAYLSIDDLARVAPLRGIILAWLSPCLCMDLES